MFRGRNKYIFSYEKKRRAATRRKVLTVFVIILAILIAFFVAISIYNSTIHIDLAKDRTIPVNAEATANQFIEGIGNGRLVEDVSIDTSKVGKQDVAVKIKVGDEIRDYTFTVDIIDTQSPVINISETRWNVMKGTPIDYISKAEVTDNSGEEIPVTVEGEYDMNSPGEQVLTLMAKDSSGNASEQNITINVIELSAGMPDMTFITPTGHNAVLKEGVLHVDGQLIVNKAFGLPESYGDGLDQKAVDALNEMSKAAAKDGIEIEEVTSYRSYREQAQLFEYWAYVAGEGENTLSAVRPGHSEHQSGLAIDVNSTQASFAGTDEANWLSANCQKYGFILRYPADKVEITGCSYEPWHVRYVGKELAETLYNNGNWITLEEYFGIPGEY